MRHHSIRCLWAAMVVLSVAGLATAREVTLKLKGGAEVVGELVGEKDGILTIRLPDGRERRVPRAQVEQMEERYSLREEYQKRRSAIADKDHEGRFELARWLYKVEDPAQQREALQLALTELDDLLKVYRNEETTFLRGLVVNKLKKLGTNGDKPGESAPPAPEPKEPDESPAPAGEPQLLSPEQVNRMKVYEVNLDSRPVVVIPNKVQEEFLNQYLRDPVDPAMRPFVGREGERRFKALEGHQQLRVMFEVKARDFYNQVVVREEPKTLQYFRTTINNRYLVNYCGRCHGEGEARGFYVITVRPGQEQTAYTNLMIAATTEVKGLPMIIKDEPERSPLLQFGLPPKEAATVHPEVKGMKPYFRGTDDPAFRTMVEWIDALYTDPRELVPDYEPFGDGESGEEPAEAEGEAERGAEPE